VLSTGFNMTLESDLNDLIGFGRRTHLRGHGNLITCAGGKINSMF
jgi:hypothetical protein